MNSNIEKTERQSFVGKTLDTDFDEHTFINCDFSSASLETSSFNDCIFRHCVFSLTRIADCSLRGVRFDNCKLVGVDFWKANRLALDISFKDCKIATCDFSKLPMKKATFADCEVTDCTFDSTDLREADFGGSSLSGTSFINCNLEEADFSHARGYGINPTSNKMKGSKFALPDAVTLLLSFGVKIDGWGK